MSHRMAERRERECHHARARGRAHNSVNDADVSQLAKYGLYGRIVFLVVGTRVGKDLVERDKIPDFRHVEQRLALVSAL